MSNHYEGYVPGPSAATVLAPVSFDQNVRVPATIGLPQFVTVVNTVPIPGTVGGFTQVVTSVPKPWNANG